MSQLTERLFELHYGLLPSGEEEPLKVRLEREPELAAEYENVKHAASLFSEAVKIALPDDFVLKRPTAPDDADVWADSRSEATFGANFAAHPGNQADGEEKKTVAAPPELPEEITSTVSVARELLLHTGSTTGFSSGISSSVQAKHRDGESFGSEDSGERTTFAHSELRTVWNPFSSRFSSKYRRVNQCLTACTVVLLLLALGGFYRIRQNQSSVIGSFFRVKVAGPGVLARSGQNTLFVAVSDIAGNPGKLPVRVSLLDDHGERILTYRESTDVSGKLALVVDVPEDLPDRVQMEVTAGESPSARSVFATLTVVDLPHEPRFPLSYAFPENAEKSLQSTETEPFFAENGDPEGFILHDGNAQIAFPKPGDIVPDRRSAAAYPSQRFNVHVNEELRKLMRGDLQTGNGEKNHARDESEEIVPTEKPEPSENALPIAAPFPAVSIVPEKRIFATHEPITCRIAAAEPKTRLLVSLSKDGIPVAQLPVETLSAPVAVEFPENDLQSGVLQISVFDPRAVPPREVASQIVFRAAERFLDIETTEPNVAESGEAKDDDQTPPPTRDSLLLKITDERGMPVQTDLRVSLWEGELPVTKTVFPPVLLENDVEIENAYAQRRADDKPFLTEFPGVLTSLSLLGGGILSLVIFAFFFFRMLSGAVPLIVSLVTATVCVLLGVSLYHDHRLPNFDAPNRLKFEKGTRDETPARMKNVAGKIVIGENVASAADSRNENTVRAKDANGGVRRRGTLLRQWSATTPRRGTVSINTKCDEYSGTQSSASEYPDPESFVTEPFAGKRENDAKNGSGERFLRVEAIGPDGRTGFFERKL